MRSKYVALMVLGLFTAELPGAVAFGGPDMMQGATFAGPRVSAGEESRRGLAALQAGAYRDAVDAFRHVTELTPSDADAWYNLGEAASALGETRTAEHAYARSVAIEPTSIDSRRELALALVKLKDNQKAAAQLDALKAQAAACKDPCPQAYELRGAITTVQGALSN
jgi:tetratricopeptide (TPR) repeat protein